MRSRNWSFLFLLITIGNFFIITYGTRYEDLDFASDLAKSDLIQSSRGRHHLQNEIRKSVLSLSKKDSQASSDINLSRYISRIVKSTDPYGKIELAISPLAKLLREFPAIINGQEHSADLIDASILLIQNWAPTSILGTLWGEGNCPKMTSIDVKKTLEAISQLDSLEGQLRYYNLFRTRCPTTYFERTQLPSLDGCRYLADDLRQSHLKNLAGSITRCAGDSVDSRRLLAINAIFTDFGHQFRPSQVSLPLQSWLFSENGFELVLQEGARAIFYIHQQLDTAIWKNWSTSFINEAKLENLITTIPLASFTLLIPQIKSLPGSQVLSRLYESHPAMIYLLRMHLSTKEKAIQYLLELDEYCYFHQLFPHHGRDPHRVREDYEAFLTTLLLLFCKRHFLPHQLPNFPKGCSDVLLPLEKNPLSLLALVKSLMDSIAFEIMTEPPTMEASKLASALFSAYPKESRAISSPNKLGKNKGKMRLPKSLQNYLEPVGLTAPDKTASCKERGEKSCQKLARTIMLDTLEKLVNQEQNLALNDKKAINRELRKVPFERLQTITKDTVSKKSISSLLSQLNFTFDGDSIQKESGLDYKAFEKDEKDRKREVDGSKSSFTSNIDDKGDENPPWNIDSEEEDLSKIPLSVDQSLTPPMMPSKDDSQLEQTHSINTTSSSIRSRSTESSENPSSERQATSNPDIQASKSDKATKSSPPSESSSNDELEETKKEKDEAEIISYTKKQENSSSLSASSKASASSSSEETKTPAGQSTIEEDKKDILITKPRDIGLRMVSEESESQKLETSSDEQDESLSSSQLSDVKEKETELISSVVGKDSQLPESSTTFESSLDSKSKGPESEKSEEKTKKEDQKMPFVTQPKSTVSNMDMEKDELSTTGEFSKVTNEQSKVSSFLSSSFSISQLEGAEVEKKRGKAKKKPLIVEKKHQNRPLVTRSKDTVSGRYSEELQSRLVDLYPPQKTNKISEKMEESSESSESSSSLKDHKSQVETPMIKASGVNPEASSGESQSADLKSLQKTAKPSEKGHESTNLSSLSSKSTTSQSEGAEKDYKKDQTAMPNIQSGSICYETDIEEPSSPKVIDKVSEEEESHSLSKSIIPLSSSSGKSKEEKEISDGSEEHPETSPITQSESTSAEAGTEESKLQSVDFKKGKKPLPSPSDKHVESPSSKKQVERSTPSSSSSSVEHSTSSSSSVEQPVNFHHPEKREIDYTSKDDKNLSDFLPSKVELTPQEMEAIPPVQLKTLLATVPPLSSFWGSLKTYLAVPGWVNSAILQRWIQAKALFGDLISNNFVSKQWQDEKTSCDTVFQAMSQQGRDEEVRNIKKSNVKDSARWEKLITGQEPLAKLDPIQIIRRIAPPKTSKQEINRVIALFQTQSSSQLVRSLEEALQKGWYKQNRGFWTWFKAKIKFGKAIADEFEPSKWSNSAIALKTLTLSLKSNDPGLYNSLKEAIPDQQTPLVQLEFFLDIIKDPENLKSLPKLKPLKSIDKLKTPVSSKIPKRLQSIYASDELLNMVQDALVSKGVSTGVIQGAEQRIIDTLRGLGREIAPQDALLAGCTRSPSLFNLVLAIQKQLETVSDFDESALIRHLALYPLKLITDIEKSSLLTSKTALDQDAQLSMLHLVYPEMGTLEFSLDRKKLAYELRHLLLKSPLQMFNTSELTFLRLRRIMPSETGPLLWETIKLADPEKSFKDALPQAFKKWASKLGKEQLNVAQFLPGPPKYKLPPCTNIDNCLSSLEKMLPSIIVKYAHDNKLEMDSNEMAAVQENLATNHELVVNLGIFYVLHKAIKIKIVSSEPFRLWFSLRTFNSAIVDEGFVMSKWTGKDGYYHAIGALSKMFPEIALVIDQVVEKLEADQGVRAILMGIKEARQYQEQVVDAMVALLRGMAKIDSEIAEKCFHSQNIYAQKAINVLGVAPHTLEGLQAIAQQTKLKLNLIDTQKYGFVIWKALKNIVGLGPTELNDSIKSLVKTVLILSAWIDPDLVNSQTSLKAVLEVALTKQDGEAFHMGQPLRLLFDNVQEDSFLKAIEQIEGGEDDSASIPSKILDLAAIVEISQSLENGLEERLQTMLAALATIQYTITISPKSVSTLNVLRDVIPPIFNDNNLNTLVDVALLGSLDFLHWVNQQVQHKELKLALLYYLTAQERYQLAQQALQTLQQGKDPLPQIGRELFSRWSRNDRERLALQMKQQALDKMAAQLTIMNDEEVLRHPAFGQLAVEAMLQNMVRG